MWEIAITGNLHTHSKFTEWNMKCLNTGQKKILQVFSWLWISINTETCRRTHIPMPINGNTGIRISGVNSNGTEFKNDHYHFVCVCVYMHNTYTVHLNNTHTSAHEHSVKQRRVCLCLCACCSLSLCVRDIQVLLLLFFVFQITFHMRATIISMDVCVKFCF